MGQIKDLVIQISAKLSGEKRCSATISWLNSRLIEEKDKVYIDQPCFSNNDMSAGLFIVWAEVALRFQTDSDTVNTFVGYDNQAWAVHWYSDTAKEEFEKLLVNLNSHLDERT